MDQTPVNLRSHGSVLGAYRAAFTEEPKIRWYVLAAFVDDIGIAVSFWATQLMMTNLFVDQRARATFMLPTLLCFLAGSIVAGPLADWVDDWSGSLPTWRWRVITWGRVLETLALGALLIGLLRGSPTLLRVLPYFLLSAFAKTALRPTRIAFQVDLLSREQDLRNPSGERAYDEDGTVRKYKTHLFAFIAITSALATAASLIGLVGGGAMLGLVHGSLLAIFGFDVLTNIVFLIVFVLRCRPLEYHGESTSWVGMSSSTRARAVRHVGLFLGHAWGRFRSVLGGAIRYLGKPAQRPLLWLLVGGGSSNSCPNVTTAK